MTPLETLENAKQVLFAGDWHGDWRHAANCIQNAVGECSDIVIQLGDFGIWPGFGGEEYLDEVERAIEEFSKPVFFIDGNHEDFEQLYALPVDKDGIREVRPGLYHLPRGFRWTSKRNGKTWLALGGATSLDKNLRTPFVSWWPQEEITYAEAEQVVAGGHADIVLTHDCPEGPQIPGITTGEYNPFWDRSELERAWKHRALLAEIVNEVAPEHLFHGHFHIRYDASWELPNGKKAYAHGIGDNHGPYWDSILEWVA